MKYLVTGASGFLGSHLCQALREQGHLVTALVRNAAPELEALGVVVEKGDVCELGAVLRAGKNCDGFFHCAGLVSRKAEDAEAMWQVHVLGTRTVVSAAKELRVPRVVVASTSGTIAVSARAEVLDESAPTPLGLISRWPYYRTKLFAETEALKAGDEKTQVICVNPSLLLGPGDVRGSSTEDVRLFLERKVMATPRGGVSFVDVRDAAAAMVLAMEKGRRGERYLITACNQSVAEFFARLSRLTGVAAPWLPMPKNLELSRWSLRLTNAVAGKLGLEQSVTESTLEVAQHFWYCSAEKAERELGWSARDPQQTLRETVDDLYARGVVWPTAARPVVPAAPTRVRPDARSAGSGQA